MNKLTQHTEEQKYYISCSIISSNLTDFNVFENTPIIEGPREILLCKLLIGFEKNDISLSKFFDNLAIFENYNHFKPYDLNRDKILRLLIFQKEKYDLSLMQINDFLKFLSVDHSRFVMKKFLSHHCFNELKCNWLKTFIKNYVNNDNISENKI